MQLSSYWQCTDDSIILISVQKFPTNNYHLELLYMLWYVTSAVKYFACLCQLNDSTNIIFRAFRDFPCNVI